MDKNGKLKEVTGRSAIPIGNKTDDHPSYIMAKNLAFLGPSPDTFGEAKLKGKDGFIYLVGI